jgi:hypothetical protein
MTMPHYTFTCTGREAIGIAVLIFLCGFMVGTLLVGTLIEIPKV